MSGLNDRVEELTSRDNANQNELMEMREKVDRLCEASKQMNQDFSEMKADLEAEADTVEVEVRQETDYPTLTLPYSTENLELPGDHEPHLL